MDCQCRLRDRPGEGAPCLFDDTPLDHRPRSGLDPRGELVTRQVEPDHERRMPVPLTPEPVRRRHERCPELCELQCPDNPAAVVRVNPGCCGGVPLSEGCMRPLGAEAVVQLLQPAARARGCRRRELEARERCTEIEAGAADDNRRLAGFDELVDRGLRKLLVFTNRPLVVEGPDSDEPSPPYRLVRQDRQAVVDLHRVGRHELAADPIGEGLGDVRLPGGGPPEDADDHYGVTGALRSSARRRRQRSAPTRRSSPSTTVITIRLRTTAPSATPLGAKARTSPYIDASRTPSPDGAMIDSTATIAPTAAVPPRNTIVSGPASPPRARMRKREPAPPTIQENA